MRIPVISLCAMLSSACALSHGRGAGADAGPWPGDAAVLAVDAVAANVDAAEPVRDAGSTDADSSGATCIARDVVRFAPGGDGTMESMSIAPGPLGFVALYDTADGRSFGGILTPTFVEASPRAELFGDDRVSRRSDLVAGGDGRVAYCGPRSDGDDTVRFLDSRGVPVRFVAVNGACVDLVYAGGIWHLLSSRDGDFFVQSYDAAGETGAPFILPAASGRGRIFAWDDHAVVVNEGSDGEFWARSLDGSSHEVSEPVSLGRLELPVHVAASGDRAYLVSAGAGATSWLTLDRSLTTRDRLVVPGPDFPLRLAMLGDRPVAVVIGEPGEVELQFLGREGRSVERIPVPVWPTPSESIWALHSIDLATSGRTVVVAATYSDAAHPPETSIWAADCP